MATKQLYHSELVKMGPVQIRVKSDVIQSTFRKDQRYVVLEIDGAERNYTCENQACEEYFEGLKGREFTIMAEGSRESAILSYVGEAVDEEAHAAETPLADPPKRTGSADRLASRAKDRAAASSKSTTTTRPPAKPPGKPGGKAPPAPATAPPARQEPPTGRPPAAPVETAEQRLKRGRLHANRVANMWLVAYSAAHFVREQIRWQFNQEVCEAQFQSCVSSIFIQCGRDGLLAQMPTGIINVAPKTAPAPAGTTAAEKEQPSDNDGGNVG